jgi:hypothetical protein
MNLIDFQKYLRKSAQSAGNKNKFFPQIAQIVADL